MVQCVICYPHYMDEALSDAISNDLCDLYVDSVAQDGPLGPWYFTLIVFWHVRFFLFTSTDTLGSLLHCISVFLSQYNVFVGISRWQESSWEHLIGILIIWKEEFLFHWCVSLSWSHIWRKLKASTRECVFSCFLFEFVSHSCDVWSYKCLSIFLHQIDLINFRSDKSCLSLFTTKKMEELSISVTLNNMIS